DAAGEPASAGGKSKPPKEVKAKSPAPKEPEPEEAEEEAIEADEVDGDEQDEEVAPPPKPAKAAAKKPRPRRAEPEEEHESRPVAAKAKSKKAAPAAEPVSELSEDGHTPAAAGPAVRRLARQLGVDLRRVRPSGAGGRVTVDDVRAHIRETNEQVAAAAPRGITPPGAPDTDDFGAVR